MPSDHPTCDLCGKGQMRTRQQCLRAARRLTHSRRNDKRYFRTFRCRSLGCPTRPWIVASMSLVNKKAQTYVANEYKRTIEHDEERQIVLGGMISDYWDFAIDPSSYAPWLRDLYGSDEAQNMIAIAIAEIERTKEERNV